MSYITIIVVIVFSQAEWRGFGIAVNELLQMIDLLGNKHEIDKIVIEPPGNDTGAWWGRIYFHKRCIEIEWSRIRGFGISLVPNRQWEPEDAFASHDAVFKTLNEAQNHVVHLLTELAVSQSERL